MKKYFRLFTNTFRMQLSEIGRSCWDVAFYREVRLRPWKRGLLYLASMLSVLFTALFIIGFLLALQLPGHVISHLATVLPVDITLKLDEGRLTSSIEPGSNIGTEDIPLIIDTGVTSDEAAVATDIAMGVVVGEEYVYFLRDGAVLSTYALSGLDDGEVGKEAILQFFTDQRISLPLIGIVTFLLAHFVALTLNLALFVPFMAWFASVVGRMWGISMRYVQWVTVSFHAVTLSVLVEHVFWAFGIRQGFVFTMLFFMIIVAVIADERASPVALKE